MEELETSITITDNAMEWYYPVTIDDYNDNPDSIPLYLTYDEMEGL
jgi:hypothetical protein